jgi:hypothetical protein
MYHPFGVNGKDANGVPHHNPEWYLSGETGFFSLGNFDTESPYILICLVRQSHPG